MKLREKFQWEVSLVRMILSSGGRKKILVRSATPPRIDAVYIEDALVSIQPEKPRARPDTRINTHRGKDSRAVAPRPRQAATENAGVTGSPNSGTVESEDDASSEDGMDDEERPGDTQVAVAPVRTVDRDIKALYEWIAVLRQDTHQRFERVEGEVFKKEDPNKRPPPVQE